MINFDDLCSSMMLGAGRLPTEGTLLTSSGVSNSQLQEGWQGMVYPGLITTSDALQQLRIKAVQRHRGNQTEAEARERCGLWKAFFFESPDWSQVPSALSALRLYSWLLFHQCGTYREVLCPTSNASTCNHHRSGLDAVLHNPCESTHLTSHLPQ